MDAQAVGLGNQHKMFLQCISSKLNLEKEKRKRKEQGRPCISTTDWLKLNHC